MKVAIVLLSLLAHGMADHFSNHAADDIRNNDQHLRANNLVPRSEAIAVESTTAAAVTENPKGKGQEDKIFLISNAPAEEEPKTMFGYINQHFWSLDTVRDVLITLLEIGSGLLIGGFFKYYF